MTTALSEDIKKAFQKSYQMIPWTSRAEPIEIAHEAARKRTKTRCA